MIPDISVERYILGRRVNYRCYGHCNSWSCPDGSLGLKSRRFRRGFLWGNRRLWIGLTASEQNSSSSDSILCFRNIWTNNRSSSETLNWRIVLAYICAKSLDHGANLDHIFKLNCCEVFDIIKVEVQLSRQCKPSPVLFKKSQFRGSNCSPNFL
jgi:hypothetical protein